MKKFQFTAIALLSTLLGACGIIKESTRSKDDTHLLAFGQDLSFFSQYKTGIIILGEGDSLIAVSPKHQSRVLTSTYAGVEGPSLGWINHELLADHKLGLQTFQIGGEDRFWIGPEGGDFSLFYPDGMGMTSDKWKAPAFVSARDWQLVSRSNVQARFETSADFTNASGYRFKIKAEREITALNRTQVSEILGIEVPESVDLVAFQSFNQITNMGDSKWHPDNGLINISVQSCFNANNRTRVFVPYRQGDVEELGDVVKDNLLAEKIDKNRLIIDPSFISFQTNGKDLSGIGISGKRSEGIILSYDAKNEILTIVLYIKPLGDVAYINGYSSEQNDRFNGDAVSVYNNGPLARTSLTSDRFYEIGTHSPALNLDAKKSQTHLQRTFHFHGSEYDLGLISYKLAGISIGQLRNDE